MLTSLVWSGATAHLIDRKFRHAALFMLVGVLLASFGFIHAGRLTGAGALYDIRWASGITWAIGYAACALLFFLTGHWVDRTAPRATGHGH
jgi:NADH:ubiquinone oxidoreductase subunit 5 (subunit L)/multisubunit Na+/H+ antiporter MnhA subunit